MIEALDAYYRESNANIHRGVYDLSQRASEAYEEARRKVAGFINAASPREIIFVRNTTEAINLVAQTWGRQHIGPGDVIVVTELDHHSNIIPWQLLAEDKGARLEAVRIDAQGQLDQAHFAELLELKPKIVALPHVSNALGTINPVAEMVAQGARGWRGGAGRCRAERAAHAGRRAGAGRRFPGLLRAQDAGADGIRSALRQAPDPGGDAALHGRRGHDPQGAHRRLDLGGCAGAVRGGHPGRG